MPLKMIEPIWRQNKNILVRGKNDGNPSGRGDIELDDGAAIGKSPIRIISADTTLDYTYRGSIAEIDTTTAGAAVTLTLPVIDAVNDGMWVSFKNTGCYKTQFVAGGTDTIEGDALSHDLMSHGYAVLVADNANKRWRITSIDRSHYYDVRDFGARPEGQAGQDNRAAFQAAFDCACAHGGGVVYVPYDEQEYFVSDTVTIADCNYLVFKGDGWSKIIAPVNWDVATNNNLFEFENVDYLWVEGLQFDQSWDGVTSSSGGGRSIWYGNEGTLLGVENCRFLNAPYTFIAETTESAASANNGAITASKFAKSIFVNNRFDTASNASINTIGGGVRETIFHGNHVINAGGFKTDGQRFANVAGSFDPYGGSTIVTANTFESCVYDAATLEEGSRAVVIADNIFRDCAGDIIRIAEGQLDEDANTVVISNNIFVDNFNARQIHVTIKPNANPVTVESLKIDGNLFQTIDQSPIFLTTGTNGTIKNVAITNNMFVDWSTGGSGTGFQEAIRFADDSATSFGVIERVRIHGNEFIREDATARNNDAILMTSQSTFGRYVEISNNYIKGDAVANEIVRFEREQSIVWVDNTVIDGEVEVRDGTVMHINGGMMLDARFAFDTGSEMYGQNVSFISTGASPYGIRCTNGTVIRPHEFYFSGLANPIFQSGGPNDVADLFSGATAQRPNNPWVGLEYFDTTVGKKVHYNGAQWVDGAGVAS